MPAEPDDKKAELKGQLRAQFNAVAPKLVAVTDLLQAFDEISSKHLGPMERMVVSGKVGKMVKGDIAGSGVYTETGADGKTVTYVHSTFVKDAMIKAVDRGDVPAGSEDVMRRVGVAATEAIQKVPDQSDKAKGGQIKPKM
ncbi:MAG: hypothetical protein ACAH80_03345 [Alphaproteobacteria bacterium]